MSTLTGGALLMSGGSRGIGLAIALRAARDGAKVVMLAKTGEPHPRLPGTVHTAAAEVEEAARWRARSTSSASARSAAPGARMRWWMRPGPSRA